MPRENLKSKDEQLRESQIVNSYFEAAQKKDDGLTQLSLALEADVTQGMVQKWLSGRSPISDNRLIWLATRLNFDPLKVRPGLDPTKLTKFYSDKEQETLKLYRLDPDFRRVVDAIAETSPFYKNVKKLDRE